LRRVATNLWRAYICDAPTNLCHAPQMYRNAPQICVDLWRVAVDLWCGLCIYTYIVRVCACVYLHVYMDFHKTTPPIHSNAPHIHTTATRACTHAHTCGTRVLDFQSTATRARTPTHIYTQQHAIEKRTEFVGRYTLHTTTEKRTGFVEKREQGL